MKALKWIAWIAGGLIALVVVGVAVIAFTVDPNEYKPDIVRVVKEKTGRDLVIAGDIELKFFPKIGAAVHGVTLSEPNGPKPFANVDEARVALALLPLLRKQFIVDQITLSGVKAELVKFEDGRTNFDDLLGGQDTNKPKPVEEKKSGSGDVDLDIGGITLHDADIGWTDRSTGTQLRASKLNLKTGRIASGVPGQLEFSGRVDGTQPKLALQLNLDGGYRFDFERGAAQFSNLQLQAKGDAAGFAALDVLLKGDTVAFDPKAGLLELSGVDLSAKSGKELDAHFTVPRLLISREKAESKPIKGDIRLVQPDFSLEAKIDIGALEGGGSTYTTKFALDAKLKREGLALDGKLATSAALDLAKQRLVLSGMQSDFNVAGPNVPNKAGKLHLEGDTSVAWGEKNADGDWRIRLPDGNLKAKWAVLNFDAPAVRFDVEADRLNLDTYFPPEKRASEGGGDKKNAAADKPIDLGALKTLDIDGRFKLGALVVSHIKAQNVQMNLRADKGQVRLDPMRAALYEGTLEGSVAIDAHRNRFAVKQRLNGISIGPFLRDAVDKDLLEGRGNVELDLTTQGNTSLALKRALDGSAALSLKDGALKGINLAEALRKAKAALGSKSASEQLAKGGEKTDFSDLTATFKIRDGVARNDDLMLRSPFLRVTGGGEIDVGQSSMNYLTKAALVNTSTGQDGKKASDVRGVTVPVRISGPLDALSYKLDFGAMAEDAAKQEVGRQLDRLLKPKSKSDKKQ